MQSIDLELANFRSLDWLFESERLDTKRRENGHSESDGSTIIWNDHRDLIVLFTLAFELSVLFVRHLRQDAVLDLTFGQLWLVEDHKELRYREDICQHDQVMEVNFLPVAVHVRSWHSVWILFRIIAIQKHVCSVEWGANTAIDLDRLISLYSWLQNSLGLVHFIASLDIRIILMMFFSRWRRAS